MGKRGRPRKQPAPATAQKTAQQVRQSTTSQSAAAQATPSPVAPITMGSLSGGGSAPTGSRKLMVSSMANRS